MTRLLETDLTLAPSEPAHESLLVAGRGGLLLWVAGAAIAVATVVMLEGQPAGHSTPRPTPTPASAGATPAPAARAPTDKTSNEAPAPASGVAPMLVATAPEPVVRAPALPPRAPGRTVRAAGLPPPAVDEAVVELEDPRDSPEDTALPEPGEVDVDVDEAPADEREATEEPDGAP